jgi:uncharacterized membrane protein YhaH (DUF805 family)
MNFFDLFKDVIVRGFKSWNIYSARSSRKDFWLWVLFVVSLNVLGLGLENASPFASKVLIALYFVSIIPSIAMWVRRIHDTGHRIWWCFIPVAGIFLNLAFCLSPTNVAETRWNSVPE